MKYVVGTASALRDVRRQLRTRLALPKRGETTGPVAWTPPELRKDEQGDPLPTPGWTTDVVGEPVMAGLLGVLEVPDEYAPLLVNVALIETLAGLPSTLRELLTPKAGTL